MSDAGSQTPLDYERQPVKPPPVPLNARIIVAAIPLTALGMVGIIDSLIEAANPHGEVSLAELAVAMLAIWGEYNALIRRSAQAAQLIALFAAIAVTCIIETLIVSGYSLQYKLVTAPLAVALITYVAVAHWRWSIRIARV